MTLTLLSIVKVGNSLTSFDKSFLSAFLAELVSQRMCKGCREWLHSFVLLPIEKSGGVGPPPAQ